MSTALVTGASAGLGAEFVRQLASAGHDVVVVARDGRRLETLAKELETSHGIATEVLVADLTTSEGLAVVESRLADGERPVDLLVNNAGFAVGRSFLRSSADDQEAMLRVLVLAVLRLTHAALPGMVARRRGAVLNVSSVAGFVSAGTYSAAKAWVTTFSEGLQSELRGTGVHAMALCPGFVRTELHHRMGTRSRGPGWAFLDAGDVVSAAMRDLRRGKVISVPGLQYKALVSVLNVMPRSVRRRRLPAGRR